VPRHVLTRAGRTEDAQFDVSRSLQPLDEDFLADGDSSSIILLDPEDGDGRVALGFALDTVTMVSCMQPRDLVVEKTGPYLAYGAISSREEPPSSVKI
jgi:hypothetical protein